MITVSCLVCNGIGQLKRLKLDLLDGFNIIRCESCKGNGEQILLEKEINYLKGVPYMVPLQWTDNMEALNR